MSYFREFHGPASHKSIAVLAGAFLSNLTDDHRILLLDLYANRGLR